MIFKMDTQYLFSLTLNQLCMPSLCPGFTPTTVSHKILDLHKHSAPGREVAHCVFERTFGIRDSNQITKFKM